LTISVAINHSSNSNGISLPEGKLTSVNPATGDICFAVECWNDSQLKEVVNTVVQNAQMWAETHLENRIDAVLNCAGLLKDRRDELARLITQEMGKILVESYAEIDKCILCCEYFAEKAPQFLTDESIESDAARSYVTYQPLGTVLGIMPWNFPFWQVFRFAIPALLTGNSVLLKHASNVPQAALMAEQLLHMAGIPHTVFRSLMIHSGQLEPLYAHPGISAIALTGSEQTGRLVAQQAGAHLKKMVLELGGSDAFIVLEDADIEVAVKTAAESRFFTSGQSCINAKRIILVEEIAEDFISAFSDVVNAIATGDPMEPSTKLGPMARADLLDNLHQQVMRSIRMGAAPIAGCHAINGPGLYYQPSILDHVTKGMPAYEEEMFGPVAAIIHASDEQEAIRIANDTRYGLGGSVWTRDPQHGEQVARRIESGTIYVNGLVKSDPRLPFGGIKHSGFGRELSRNGMLEFTNAKTLWIG
jgi:succinate-semialdehyde dehydrogenase/glutarate-semialdehyde dehydrogenase